MSQYLLEYLSVDLKIGQNQIFYMVFQQLGKITSIHSFEVSIAKIIRPIYVLQDLKECTIVAGSFAMAAWSNIFFENLLCGVIKMWKDVSTLKVIKPSSFVPSLSVCLFLSLFTFFLQSSPFFMSKPKSSQAKHYKPKLCLARRISGAPKPTGLQGPSSISSLPGQ